MPTAKMGIKRTEVKGANKNFGVKLYAAFIQVV